MKRADDEPDLLSAPLAGASVGKLYVVIGPIALAVAIALALWVSYMHVRFTAVVQAPSQLVPGRSVAMRIHVLAETSTPAPEVFADVWVEHEESRYDIGRLLDVGVPGIAQATLPIPELPRGAATIGVEIRPADGTAFDPMLERIQVTVRDRAEPLKPDALVSESAQQRGDDSDPQPERVCITFRPLGRLVSEFDNKVYLRVTHPDGRPFVGQASIKLVSGAFANKTGSSSSPPTLHDGPLDALGMLSTSGRLLTEVLRLRAEVTAPDGSTVGARTVRTVSFPGGAVVLGEPRIVSADAPGLKVWAEGLRPKPVFVDVHDAAGIWAATLEPPLVPGQGASDWQLPPVDRGLLQLEAYTSVSRPGSSTDVLRVWAHREAGADAAPISELVDAHLAAIERPRVEPEFDAEHERKWLQAVKAATLTASQRQAASDMLLGTLPLAMWGPPVAVANRARRLADMAAYKRMWTVRARWILLGGGGLFLALLTASMVRAHARGARSTLAAVGDDPDGRAEVEAAVQAAKRNALLWGLGVIAAMAAGLVLGTFLLESLLWTH